MHRVMLVHWPGLRASATLCQVSQPASVKTLDASIRATTGRSPTLQMLTALVIRCGVVSHGSTKLWTPLTVASQTMAICLTFTAAVSFVLTGMPLVAPTPEAVAVLVTPTQCSTPDTVQVADWPTASVVGKVQPARLI